MRSRSWSRRRSGPKSVREHHLRQWYVLGDLYDRVGDPISARRWFARDRRGRPRVRRRRATAALTRSLNRSSHRHRYHRLMPSMQFRAGVVAVVTNAAGQVMAFERSDVPGAWQLPQGGIDVGEATDAAAWRELFEETGLGPDQVELVGEYPEWTVYEWPAELRAAGKGRGAAAARPGAAMVHLPRARRRCRARAGRGRVLDVAMGRSRLADRTGRRVPPRRRTAQVLSSI